MRSPRVLFVLPAVVLAASVTWAQVGRGGSEWLTGRGDAQRTSWLRADAKISLESMSAPGFELQWTSKLDNQPRGLNGLAHGVTANGVTLFVPMSIVTGSSNRVYAVDNDTGHVVWQRQFDAPMPAATAECPGGIMSAATRIVSLEAAETVPAPLSFGRSMVGYRSLLGEPGQGVPVEPRGAGPGRAGAPAAGAPGPGGPQRGGQPAAGAGAAAGGRGGGAPGGRAAAAPSRIPGAPDAGGGAGRGGAFSMLFQPSGVAYVVTSDGLLHVLGLPSGKDMQRPAPFLPANARWSDPIAVSTTLYAATSGGCGGAPNAVWAIDLDSETKPVVSWRTNGGHVVGSVAFTSTGTLIAAIGGPGQTTGDGKANAIVALDPATLQLRDWFTQANADLVTGPTVFRHGDREIVAAATKDGRLLLLDATSLGGADHATPLYVSPPFAGTGGAIADAALATWEQPAPQSTRWILVPVSGALSAGLPATNDATRAGAVLALKLVDSNGSLSLEPGWVSQDLVAPATPIIVNGVAFALSTGRPATASGRGTPAVLRAYDAATGRALWNSGGAMAAFASPGSFWSAMGQAYVGTHDGTLYAFGFLDERR
jgi:outer membrane protein assembly factor BamB